MTSRINRLYILMSVLQYVHVEMESSNKRGYDVTAVLLVDRYSHTQMTQRKTSEILYMYHKRYELG